MRFAPAATALALILAACGSSDSAHHGDGGDQHAAADAHNEDHGGGEHGSLIGPADAHAATPAPQQHSGEATHWSYANQRAWAGVSGMCGRGREQSPINLASAAPMAEMPDLVPHYLQVAGGFADTGHTLQFTPAESRATLTIGADSYTMAQLHFHSPAEHTLDRRAYPAELHFVHRNANGQLAVVGVFIEEGEENPALAALLSHRPAQQGDEHAEQLEVNLMALLPPDRAYFAYAGSLTTPPCSEGVRWNVLRTPITASPDQIAMLREALAATSRHVQPANERTVLLGS